MALYLSKIFFNHFITYKQHAEFLRTLADPQLLLLSLMFLVYSHTPFIVDSINFLYRVSQISNAVPENSRSFLGCTVHLAAHSNELCPMDRALNEIFSAICFILFFN